MRAGHRHGTRGAYNRDRCRCAACVAANTAHHRDRRRRLAVARWNGGDPIWVDPAGTRRRLQALTAVGWSTTQVAAELAVTKTAVAQLRSTERDRVLASTAANVATLYDRLWWCTPPATEGSATRSELYAARAGWAPPWAWDGCDIDDPAAEPVCVGDGDLVDPVLIERAVTGGRVRLSRLERRVVVDELTRRRRSAAEIAEQLAVSTRLVQRDRRHNRARSGRAA